MKKPELLITAGSTAEIETYAMAGADAVLVGEDRFALRMPGKLDRRQIGEAIQAAHDQGIKIYVSVHNIMTHELADDLPDYLNSLSNWGADAVVFGDPAVLMALSEEQINMKLHWNAEMTSTNIATANFWGSKGAARVVLARELNLQEVGECKSSTSLEVEVQIHGITNIYHSKRHLVRSYLKHLEREKVSAIHGPEQGLYLVEQERRNLKLPIYEDWNGTHIMSADDLCMIESLDELLELGLDSLKIEALMKTPEYNETVVRMYREAIDSYCKDPGSYRFNVEWLEKIEELQDKDRELTFGFFFKEQVY